MKNFLSILIVLFTIHIAVAQEMTYKETEVSVSKHIDGTLLIPNDIEKPILVIIIAGSGPTDRNGNQNFMKNDALKKLAESLTAKSIATFRYDKRIIKQILNRDIDKDLLFDDFVSDAKAVVTYFTESEKFSKIYIAGHSQGSLVGMLASEKDVDGFISLAGAGQNIGDVIVEQVAKMSPQLGEEAQKVVNKLKSGEKTTDFPQALASVFNADIQDFMINWMSYEPTEIIHELKIPILIINGTKDLQVSENEANLLKEANENAQLNIIENMNHVLFEIVGGDLENSKSYNESSREISALLIENIVNFVKK
ncbi:MAG: alpha/beta hydrolase [Winogradskyella sp.]|uniref:alpha/beta hydrolase family protein n=1 Tax=Winogradskyella sp. TaxID=1883156 RepID=UPI0025EC5D28|nr:alpha/beta hydrolase [Winogradskyella sp.]NRB58839.1 alpha/beta hydrolase [Winogradskyella sp.]